MAPYELRSEHASAFHAELRAVQIGAAQASMVTQQSVQSNRTARLIRQSDPEHYHCGINLCGHVQMTQDRRSAALRPGDLTLFDTSRPFRCTTHYGDGLGFGLLLAFPRGLLPLPDNKVKDLIMARFSVRSGIGRLLTTYLSQLITNPGQYRPGDATRLGSISLDLLAAMLAHELDMTVPAETRRQALLARIHAFIDQHLGDPSLTPQAIAAAHHVSTRYLHKLFHDQGRTVAGWVRQRRLDRARRDLADPQAASTPIHGIAARWGFADAAHFSRAFRAAYGLPPRDYRRLAGQPEAVRGSSSTLR